MQEKRADSRMLCSELVDVHWQDGHGQPRKVLANLEDISSSGVCLQMDTPVPLDTMLRICHNKGEFQGSVRYCLFREIGYFLGVQLAPGSQWSPQAYEPQHLLDLRTLVMRSAKRAAGEPDGDPALQ
jgi:hypothetical protein